MHRHPVSAVSKDLIPTTRFELVAQPLERERLLHIYERRLTVARRLGRTPVVGVERLLADLQTAPG